MAFASMRQALIRRATGNRGLLKRGPVQNRYSRIAANALARRKAAMPGRYAGKSMFFGSRPNTMRYFRLGKM